MTAVAEEAPAAAQDIPQAPPVTAPAPAAALAVRSPRDLAAAIPAKLRYAQALAESGLLPAQYRGRPGNVLWAVEFGEMLGIGAMAAITGVHVIEGKPTASAGLISGLVRKAGHKLRVWGNNNSATCEIVRADDPEFTYRVTWTLKRNSDGNPSAEEAGLLGKAVWKNYAASMLKSRAISQCARDAAEDVLFGVHYTPEELGAPVDEEGNLILEVVTDGAATDYAWFDQAMTDAPALPTLDKCRELWAMSAELVGQGRCAKSDAIALQDVLRKRMDTLKASEPHKSAAAESEAAVADAAVPKEQPRCPEVLFDEQGEHPCSILQPDHPGQHDDGKGMRWPEQAVEPAAAAEPATDHVWLTRSLNRVPTLATLGDCRGLWAESSSQVEAGNCTKGDAIRLQQAISARMNALQQAETPAEPETQPAVEPAAEPADGGQAAAEAQKAFDAWLSRISGAKTARALERLSDDVEKIAAGRPADDPYVAALRKAIGDREDALSDGAVGADGQVSE